MANNIKSNLDFLNDHTRNISQALKTSSISLPSESYDSTTKCPASEPRVISAFFACYQELLDKISEEMVKIDEIGDGFATMDNVMANKTTELGMNVSSKLSKTVDVIEYDAKESYDQMASDLTESLTSSGLSADAFKETSSTTGKSSYATGTYQEQGYGYSLGNAINSNQVLYTNVPLNTSINLNKDASINTTLSNDINTADNKSGESELTSNNDDSVILKEDNSKIVNNEKTDTEERKDNVDLNINKSDNDKELVLNNNKVEEKEKNNTIVKEMSINNASSNIRFNRTVTPSSVIENNNNLSKSITSSSELNSTNDNNIKLDVNYNEKEVNQTKNDYISDYPDNKNTDYLSNNTVDNNIDINTNNKKSSNNSAGNVLKTLAGVGLAAGATYGTYKYVKDKKEKEEDEFNSEDISDGGEY